MFVIWNKQIANYISGRLTVEIAGARFGSHEISVRTRVFCGGSYSHPSAPRAATAKLAATVPVQPAALFFGSRWPLQFCPSSLCFEGCGA